MPMNQDAKKTALRMIPYGIYVLTADDGKGNVSAATVNWVTQTAFNPPLVVVGVKTDSHAYPLIKNQEFHPQHAWQGAQGARLHLLQAGAARRRQAVWTGDPQGHERRSSPRRRP